MSTHSTMEGSTEMQSMLYTCDNCGWGTFNSNAPRRVNGAMVMYEETGRQLSVCGDCIDLIKSATWHEFSEINLPTAPTRKSVRQHEADKEMMK